MVFAQIGLQLVGRELGLKAVLAHRCHQGSSRICGQWFFEWESALQNWLVQRLRDGWLEGRRQQWAGGRSRTTQVEPGHGGPANRKDQRAEDHQRRAVAVGAKGHAGFDIRA